LGSADDGGMALVYPGEMSLDLVAALALAFPIVEAAPGVEGPCPGYYEDPCEDVAHWDSLQARNADRIPSDGVLVLQGGHDGPWDEDAMANVVVEVTLDAQPIAGTLELGPMGGVLVWRPDAPWTAGATHGFRVTVMDTDGPEPSCMTSSVGHSGDLIVDSEPGAPLEVPVLEVMKSVRSDLDIDLTSLACCEGESPAMVPGWCGFPQYSWDPKVCAPVRGTGFLRVDFTGEPAAEGPAAQQIVYTRKVDGLADLNLFQPQPVFSVVLPGPYCVEIEAHDLASGEITTSGRQCFGEDVAEQLGPQAIEPPEALTCSLQRCAPTEFGWDLERCMPHGPQSGEADTAGQGGGSGCGCVVGGAGDAGLLALIGGARCHSPSAMAGASSKWQKRLRVQT
jgi:hypothetical protein